MNHTVCITLMMILELLHPFEARKSPFVVICKTNMTFSDNSSFRYRTERKQASQRFGSKQ